ncbi:hypothetical protein BC828DRAFT_386224 [Blastocladiella britannica]|nr:hypothetical protein BC828DRAFT_386224 [Blastocladiella britannica]
MAVHVLYFCVNIHNNKYYLPLQVTTEMVDAASTAGVHMLDIVWQMHCHLLRLPPMDFPHTTKAIDSAQDVDTLKWWWQKHVQFGLPFKHAEAVHGAIAGRVARETVPDPVQPKAHWLATVKEDRPTQLAMCQWWRDRATIDGLVHFHKTDDAENHLNNEGDAALRSIEFDDLGTLAVDGRVDLLEAWAAMVDSALLPPITEPTDFFSDDQTLPDPPALSWWWRRHVDHGLPFPDVADLLVSASENGRIDTLDWIWNSSLPAASTPSARLVPLVAPDLFYITRDTRHTVLPWWLERADRDPSFKLPMLSWSWDDRDTLEDLQAFWNLQTRGQQSGNEGLRDINDHYFPYHHFPCHQDQRPAVDAVVARSS